MAGSKKVTARTVAKTGMAVSMGVLLTSALMDIQRSDTSRRIHIAAGAALTGFSVWHYSLYRKSGSSK